MDGTPFGRYQLLELLGRGGMGEVWRAHDTEIDRTVAIKTLLPHFAQDEKFVQRFRREARLAARLDDPHVVPIYDVGEIGGQLYVSMRLIQGQDLQTLLGDGPLPSQRAVGIIGQVAKALNAAHKAGLVHRDIKPSNILIAENDYAYLIDFGIAKAAGETGLTSTGATIGTWSYMAPERFSTGVAEASSDIYALACVLYQCLTGQLPFPAVALEQIAVAHMTAAPPKPSAHESAVPEAMDAVIETGLAKDPGQRYSTTVELATAAHSAVTEPLRRASAPISQPLPLPTGYVIPASRGAANSDRPTDSFTASPEPLAAQLAAPTVARAAAPLDAVPPAANSHSSRGPGGRTKKLFGTLALIGGLAAIVAFAVTAGPLSSSSGTRSSAASSTVGTSSSTWSTSIQEPTPSNDSVRQLLALVPAGDHCKEEYNAQHDEGVLAKVDCAEIAGQVTVLHYQLLSDQAALDRYILQTNGDRQACPGLGQSPQYWHHSATPQQTEGKVSCFQWAGYPWVDWSVNSQLLTGEARGLSTDNVDQIFQWWSARNQ